MFFPEQLDIRALQEQGCEPSDHPKQVYLGIVPQMTKTNSLVPAWCTLPGVLGLPPQAQSLGPAESRAGPDLLLPVAMDSLQHGLLGLQSLRLGLSLGWDSCERKEKPTNKKLNIIE